MDSHAFGRRAEEAAANYLEQAGYALLRRNYRVRGGEIDLIARQGETLVFVEVKARSSAFFGAPREAVGPEKQRRLTLAAGRYLQESGFEGFCRFDVIEADEGLRLNHIKNAFETTEGEYER